MKIKLIRIAIWAIATWIVSCAIASFSTSWLPANSPIINAIIGTIVSALYEFIDTHGYGIRLWFDSQIRYANTSIRISFSYLYRIEVDGKYLLVRGNRLKNQYQPVGGVYKYYREAKSFLDSIDAIPDQKMENSDDSDDLRLLIKGKYLLSFLDWFFSMVNREYDPMREFREELIDSELLPVGDFSRIEYRKVKTKKGNINYSKFNCCNELLLSDIFEIVLSDSQQKAIRNAVDNHPAELCLASVDEIKKLCYGGIQKNLGTNTPWILGEE